MRFEKVLVLVCVLAPHALFAADAASITVLPAEFTLTGTAARQRVLVERIESGNVAGQITEGVELVSSDPGVVRIEEGIAVPVADGNATITANVGGLTAATQVTVAGQGQPHAWSFRNHVQSVLSKAGCNSGACHGAAAGQNGFRLSLRGYDPEFDFFSITRDARGRRIVPDDPGRSLVLTKPTGAVPHKGGVRFQVDSPEYRVVSEWIAQGNPAPTDTDPLIERLEILPESSMLRKGATQQLVVRAHFTDGHAEDVTRWAKYTSTNHSVAKVDDFGKVEIGGSGEGAVIAWYLSRNVVASMSVPYETELPPETFANAERGNLIDELVLEKLAQLNIPPSPIADDSEFLRRVYLDTIGILPTADESKQFLADTSPNKREAMIDYLLTRPEYVDYWTYKWSDLLLLSGSRLRPEALTAFYDWIRGHVRDNTPWDKFAEEIVTARGSTLTNGAANFYSLHEDPRVMAETVSMAFLGMSINCARCHDHPLEKWTNDQYFGMANLFARVRGKGWGGAAESGNGARTVFTVVDGELIQPRTGRPQVPRPLDGESIAFDATEDRREHLAAWLTSRDNPYFSRAIVNRVWANYLGVGIVEAVDDVRTTNPPSNEKLLASLSTYLEANNYDLKSLMRLILTSSTYQRASRTVPGNEPDERFYSHYYPRRLPAEVMLDAVSQVTGVPTEFAGYAKGTRALQLKDSAVASYFLSTFGRPERLITCECERSDEPSMTQVLHLMNGDTLLAKLETEKNVVADQLAANAPVEQIVDRLYLSALSRPASEDERAQIAAVLAEASEADRRATLEDLYWSVLSSKEFLFNH